MSDNVENLILEQLKALRSDILTFRSESQSDFNEIKHRLSRVESGIANMRGENAGTQEDVYRSAISDRHNQRKIAENRKTPGNC